MNLRESIKKELRLLTEQTSGGVKHKWQGYQITGPGFPGNCQAGGISNVCLWSHPGCNNNTPAANEAFYQFMGSPSVGEIVGCNGTMSSSGLDPHKKCWIYKGTGNTPSSVKLPGWSCNNPTGPHSSCADCSDTTPQPSCTHGNTSPCASQWFQNPNATWAATWMNNRDCSNYTWPSINLEQDAMDIMNDPTTPNPQTGPYNDWNDIWGAGHAAWPNTTGAPKTQFIAKMAKAKFSQCQKQACNC